MGTLQPAAETLGGRWGGNLKPPVFDALPWAVKQADRHPYPSHGGSCRAERGACPTAGSVAAHQPFPEQPCAATTPWLISVRRLINYKNQGMTGSDLILQPRFALGL